jgi:hypothetical protein
VEHEDERRLHIQNSFTPSRVCPHRPISSVEPRHQSQQLVNSLVVQTEPGELTDASTTHNKYTRTDTPLGTCTAPLLPCLMPPERVAMCTEYCPRKQKMPPRSCASPAFDYRRLVSTMHQNEGCSNWGCQRVKRLYDGERAAHVRYAVFFETPENGVCRCLIAHQDTTWLRHAPLTRLGGIREKSILVRVFVAGCTRKGNMNAVPLM